MAFVDVLDLIFMVEWTCYVFMTITIHGRLMINGPTIHCKVYVPVRHVSHSLDLGYVAGLLLLCSVYAAKAYWTFALFHLSRLMVIVGPVIHLKVYVSQTCVTLS